MFHRGGLEYGMLPGLGGHMLGDVAEKVKDAHVTIAQRASLAAQGLSGLIDSWVASSRAILEGSDQKRRRVKINLFDHKLVIKLLPDYLDEIAEAEQQVAELAQEKTTFEQGPEDERDNPLPPSPATEADEGTPPTTYAKALDTRLKTAKNALKTIQQHLKRKTSPTPDLLPQQAAALTQEIEALTQTLAPYKEIKRRLGKAKRHLTWLREQLLTLLESARAKLMAEDYEEIVLSLAKKELITDLDSYTTAHRRQVIVAVEQWWDKYHTPLQAIEAEDAVISQRLEEYLRGLGYGH